MTSSHYEHNELARKICIENELREMNELLMQLVQKPDTSAKFQGDIISLLRDMASIRDRMLSNTQNDASLELRLKNEIAQLVIKTRSFLFAGQRPTTTPPSPCTGPLL